MSIPVRNLYYLLCYAWRRLPEAGIGEHGQEVGKDLADLFARFLSHGFLAQARRGLDRFYANVVEESAALRGKGLWFQTAQARSMDRGRVICEYQELSPDTLSNRLVKAGLQRLERHPDLDPDLHSRVRLCLVYLEGVKSIRLEETAFRGIQFHGGLRGYAWLIDACRLLARWSLPDENGAVRFRDILRDESQMAGLFEQFVRGFFEMNETDFSLDKRSLDWPWEALSEEAKALLPGMQTDITLRRGDHVIVIDTKYYAKSLTDPSDYRKETLRSAHLYQMHAYLSTFASKGAKPLKGILLYPKVDRDIHVAYRHDDYEMRVETIDLNAGWRDIHEGLLGLVSS